MIDKNTEIYNIKGIFNNYRNGSVSVDLDRYGHLLDDPSLSVAEKEEFLKALWSIITTFIDLGFGVHPLQEALGTECPVDLKQDFDNVEDTDSNSDSKKNGSLARSPEVT